MFESSQRLEIWINRSINKAHRFFRKFLGCCPEGVKRFFGQRLPHIYLGAIADDLNYVFRFRG
jgi:hypothetical protein